FGFHILRIDQRVPGKQMPFDVARERVAMDLQGQALTRALEQYVRILAGQAKVVGVDLGAVGVPLVN
ncbi:peptidyl-prolyl cis-trans isomerase, partial [Staphylococcus aureus]|nr:peptidyl-prolyl cis-trans isomerase [Staphylococcus aureus]